GHIKPDGFYRCRFSDGTWRYDGRLRGTRSLNGHGTPGDRQQQTFRDRTVIRFSSKSQGNGIVVSLLWNTNPHRFGTRQLGSLRVVEGTGSEYFASFDAEQASE